MTSIANYVTQAIKEAPIMTEPFRHIVVRNIWPNDFYPQILVSLPERKDMAPLGVSTPNRFLYWLTLEGDFPPVLPFWDVLRTELFNSLWKTLEEKFGLTGSKMGAELIHDFPGYQLGPHTDTNDKLITGLFYLPVSTTNFEQGTVLFKCDQPDLRGKGHRFGPDYAPVKTIMYAPNVALFFPRTDFSYHGVMPTPVERWLLAFDIFK